MKEIKNILICGAGMMGKNIGYVFASNPSFQVGCSRALERPTAPGMIWSRLLPVS